MRLTDDSLNVSLVLWSEYLVLWSEYVYSNVVYAPTEAVINESLHEQLCNNQDNNL